MQLPSRFFIGLSIPFEPDFHLSLVGWGGGVGRSGGGYVNVATHPRDMYLLPFEAPMSGVFGLFAQSNSDVHLSAPLPSYNLHTCMSEHH